MDYRKGDKSSESYKSHNFLPFAKLKKQKPKTPELILTWGEKGWTLGKLKLSEFAKYNVRIKRKACKDRTSEICLEFSSPPIFNLNSNQHTYRMKLYKTKGKTCAGGAWAFEFPKFVEGHQSFTFPPTIWRSFCWIS